MENKVDVIKLSFAIQYTKNTVQKYQNDVEEKIFQIKKSFESLEKYTSSLESLINKIKVENDISDILNIKKERKEISDTFGILSRRIFSLNREIENINDKYFNYVLVDIFDKVVELSKDAHSSANCSKSQSLPEASESESAFDDYSQNIKSNCFQEYLKDEKYFNEYSIKKNSSASSNFLSSGDMEIVNLIPEEKCCNHNDREAVWTCKDNYSKKFCEICSENMGFKTQGKLIKINELIVREIDESQKIKNFLACFEKVILNIADKCNVLVNFKKIPDLPLIESVTFSNLDNSIQFIEKVFEEYQKLKIYKDEMKLLNIQVLAILKNLSLWKNIDLQSAKIDTNIFSEIKKYSQFFIKVFLHRNLINEKELIKRITPTLEKKYNKKFIITEGNAFIEVNDYIDSKNHKNIYEVKETEILNIINILSEMHYLKNFLNKEWKINENKFETKYDAPIFSSNEIEMIGGKKFYNPIGWFGIGIKQNKNYDCGDWPIAYITFNKKLTNEQIRQIFHLILEKENMDILVYNKDKKVREEFDRWHWDKIGTGIYLFQDISKAENKTGEFDINGKKYKILLMVKVQKDKIKEPINNKHGYWIVEKDFVKIYRILFK